MTKFNLRAFLVSTAMSASLVFTSAAVTTFVLTADAAYAKGNKGNGNGNGNGNGGGKGKGKGQSGGQGKASKGADAGKSKSGAAKDHKERKYTTKNGRVVKVKSGKAKNGKNQKTSLAGLGREFKRDVEQLFGKRSAKKSKRNTTKTTRKTYKTASISPIEQSPRPVTRSVKRYVAYDKKKHHKHYYRDPLVDAITDPYGSDKLRNLNASNAAAQAFKNASPNSNVGKIATYQAAAENYYGLRSDLYDARRDLKDLNESYNGRSSYEINDDIENLDPNDPNYDDKLGALEKELQHAERYEEARDDLRDDVRDLKAETRDALYDAESAFYDASKGRALTHNTLGDFHSNLGLPQPKDHHKYDEAKQPYDYEDSYYAYSKDKTFQPVETNYRLHYEEADYSNKKYGKRHYRDPLVDAITDPYGSDKLRNLNASNAAAQAFKNASPNSNVGKIATYQAAAENYYGLRSDLYDARRDLKDLNESFDGRSSDEIADDIAALDPGDPNYEDQLDSLENELHAAEAYEETRDDLRGDVKDLRVDTMVAQKQAEYAFYDASKGTALTPDALAELHENLELPTTTD